MLLKPSQNSSERKLNNPINRLLIIPGKTLPSTLLHQRKWAFVDMLSKNIEELVSALGASTHETKGAGHVIVPPARACGEVCINYNFQFKFLFK